MVPSCTTVTGDAALPVRLLDPGLTATVFTSVAPAGTLSTAAVDGGIFCVAAAAAASAAIPLICGLLPAACGQTAKKGRVTGTRITRANILK